MRRSMSLLLAATFALGTGGAVAAASEGATFEPTAKSFANCTALNRRYPQGVGRPRAVNRVNGRSTGDRNHYKSRALYRANSNLDRDKDGVACEA